MFWGRFNYHGDRSLQPIAGTMPSSQYIEGPRRRVVAELEKRYPSGSGIFQQDLDPCNTSQVVKKFMTEKNIPNCLARIFSGRQIR